MFKRISIILLILFTLLAFTIGASAVDPGLFVEKDEDNTYIKYVNAAGTNIMTIDDTDGVTIASLSTTNTYTAMTLTSTLDASSLTVGSFVTPGGIACAKQLYLGDDLDMSVSGNGVYDITLKDGVADALSITREGTDIIVFKTSATVSVTITPATTISGALTCGSTLAVGASDDGETVTFYGDNAGSDFVWDEEGDTNNGTLTLGGNTDGVDFKAYALTTGNYLLWDHSTDDLLLVGTATQLHIAGTTTSTTPTTGSLKTAGGLGVAENVNIGGTLTVGTDGGGTDVKIYGDIATYYVWWDANANTEGTWYFGADTKGVHVNFYSITTGCGVFWNPDGDTNNGVLSVGATGGSAGVDFIAYGNTTGNYLHWDQSTDDLLLVGTAVMMDIAGTTDSTGVTSGALSIDGGLGVAKSIFVGGNISIATGKIITTTAELTLNSVNPLTIQFGGVDWLQMDEGAISGFAGATNTAGHAVYIESEDGGADGGSATGKAGGAVSLKTGDGSAAATTNAVGGAGGAFTLTTGAGLTANGTGVGGVGGAVAVTAGAGGSSGGATGTGGVGGSITLTAGAGGAAAGGTAGAPGKVDIAAGLLHMGVQTIDMSNTTVVLTLVPGTPVGTLLTGNIMYVDANGDSAEVLKLPHEADADGVLLVIYNTGGESITIQNDAAGAILTLETVNTAVLVCDGTTWAGFVAIP